MNRLKSSSLWLLAILILGLTASFANGAEVTARLIYATNIQSADGTKQPEGTATRLSKAFGWKEYWVLSQPTASLKEGEIQQFNLGKKFFLRIKLVKDQKSAYLMRCELLQGEKTALQQLLQADPYIQAGSAFFIAGPKYEEGQLLISIAIR